MATPSLGSACDFFSSNKHVMPCRVLKAGLRDFWSLFRGDFRFKTTAPQRLNHPDMDFLVRIGSLPFQKRMLRRNDQRVGKIGSVLDNTAAGPAPDMPPLRIQSTHMLAFFEVAKGDRGPGPFINPQERLSDIAEQELINGHIQCPRVRGRVNQEQNRVEKRSHKAHYQDWLAKFKFEIGKCHSLTYCVRPMSKVALGKGLSALINTRVASPTPAPEMGERVQQIELTAIVPTPFQPRTEFRDERLQELMESVREHGIIQPLIVRKRNEKFELIAGERRWRAAKELGLKNAPVIVREASDQEVLELALIENLQREDLNPIEEALAFQRLVKEFTLKQEEIAQKVGKSRAAVANSMRLLELDPQVQTWLVQNRISVGHAKVLLSLKSGEEQKLIAESVIRHNHTVRATEKIVAAHFAQQGEHKPGRNGKAISSVSPAIQHLQNRLQSHFATHVSIQHSDKKGRIEIEYYGNDDLQRILGAFGLAPE